MRPADVMRKSDLFTLRCLLFIDHSSLIIVHWYLIIEKCLSFTIQTAWNV